MKLAVAVAAMTIVLSACKPVPVEDRRNAAQLADHYVDANPKNEWTATTVGFDSSSNANTVSGGSASNYDQNVVNSYYEYDLTRAPDMRNDAMCYLLVNRRTKAINAMDCISTK